MLAVCERKQHRDTLATILSCFLAALGQSGFCTATAKSPSAISRFLNTYSWSLRTLLRVMRRHALNALRTELGGCRGRPPVIEIIVDTTSIAKEGEFALLDDWIHTLHRVRGLHLVVLYLCCGELRLPWGLRIWRGKGTPSPNDLALKLIRELPKEILARSRHLHVLADSGFSSIALLSGLNDLGIRFTVGMRKNRLTLEGQALHQITGQNRKVELQWLAGQELWVSWIWLPGRREGAREQRFLMTNRRRSAQTVRKSGRRRWKIEALFKTMKSRFALGKFGQKSKLGVLRYLCLSFCCFLLCHLEQLDGRVSGQDESWPDWGKLARRVRRRLIGWVRLIEIEREKLEILIVMDADFANAA